MFHTGDKLRIKATLLVNGEPVEKIVEHFVQLRGYNRVEIDINKKGDDEEVLFTVYR